MDQSTTLSVRKIRYVIDNMPARVRDVRKGYKGAERGVGHSKVQQG